MVYAANAGLIINGAAIVARFKHAERADEATAYAAWMGGRGHDRWPPTMSTRARATCWWSAR